jgi:hypothetical protein
MVRAIWIGAFIVMSSGCVAKPFSSLTDRTHRVWDGIGSPPATLAAPGGFRITPAQAYRIVTEGKPQKFSFYIYADRTHYYFAPNAPLKISTSGNARSYGITVDGVTGVCLKCNAGSVIPPDTALEGSRER